MTRPVGLSLADLAEMRHRFGVAEVQVRRDHAISHILAVLSRYHRDELLFFGGTALSRAHLLDARLSEDIVLIATGDRDALADLLAKEISTALTRTLGRITWAPGWQRDSDVDAALAVTPDGVAIQIQLLRIGGYAAWPTELRAIEQRYSDAPPATLRVPTPASFAGWKTAAWLDRGAARDLYDLWGLSQVGALTAESAALFAKCGPTNTPPRPWMFERSPSPVEWLVQLGEQVRIAVTPDDALAAVRVGWAAALGEDWSN
ncbi:MAG: nucleotidyl transferase AbiEii/AbiGii toxin family protein [Mycobacteriales bacterium]